MKSDEYYYRVLFNDYNCSRLFWNRKFLHYLHLNNPNFDTLLNLSSEKYESAIKDIVENNNYSEFVLLVIYINLTIDDNYEKFYVLEKHLNIVGFDFWKKCVKFRDKTSNLLEKTVDGLKDGKLKFIK